MAAGTAQLSHPIRLVSLHSWHRTRWTHDPTADGWHGCAGKQIQSHALAEASAATAPAVSTDYPDCRDLPVNATFRPSTARVHSAKVIIWPCSLRLCALWTFVDSKWRRNCFEFHSFLYAGRKVLALQTTRLDEIPLRLASMPVY